MIFKYSGGLLVIVPETFDKKENFEKL